MMKGSFSTVWIRKKAWPVYIIISGVRLYWELEEPEEPTGETWGGRECFRGLVKREVSGALGM